MRRALKLHTPGNQTQDLISARWQHNSIDRHAKKNKEPISPGKINCLITSATPPVTFLSLKHIKVSHKVNEDFHMQNLYFNLLNLEIKWKPRGICLIFNEKTNSQGRTPSSCYIIELSDEERERREKSTSQKGIKMHWGHQNLYQKNDFPPVAHSLSAPLHSKWSIFGHFLLAFVSTRETMWVTFCIATPFNQFFSHALQNQKEIIKYDA